MANRKRTRAKKATSNAQVNALVKSVKQLSVKPKKSKPFRDTGGIVGNRIGGMFGQASLGRGIGRWLGTGIGSIFGSGDYTLMGSSPSYNVMVNGNQIPKFNTSRQTNVVCHREYLGDITGTAAFNNTTYPLNPGISTTFPWLSSVATSYQEYKFHGLVFEFRSLITDFVTGGAPGVLVMSTNYNADAPSYTTKQEMENAEFAVATKPTMNLMHGVECADTQTILPQRYVRVGDVPSGQDLRLYDSGNFQLATASNPVQNLGELWVSYCVEFFKPIQAPVTGVPGIGAQVTRSGTTNANPFGTVAQLSVGGLDVTVVGTGVTINNAIPGRYYQIMAVWLGSAGVAFVPGSNSFSGCTTVAINSTFSAVRASAISYGGLSGTTANVSATVTVQSNRVAPGAASWFVGTAGVYPTGFVDIFITQLDPALEF